MQLSKKKGVNKRRERKLQSVIPQAIFSKRPRPITDSPVEETAAHCQKLHLYLSVFSHLLVHRRGGKLNRRRLFRRQLSWRRLGRLFGLVHQAAILRQFSWRCYLLSVKLRGRV